MVNNQNSYFIPLYTQTMPLYELTAVIHLADMVQEQTANMEEAIIVQELMTTIQELTSML